MKEKITPEGVLAFLKTRNGRASKADIARHFKITGNDRIGMKNMLKDMLRKGLVHQGSFRQVVLPNLPAKESSPRKRGSRDDKRLDSRLRGNDKSSENNQVQKTRFVGLYQPLSKGGGLVQPISRADKNPILIPEGAENDAREDDLVAATFKGRAWKIDEVLARKGDAGMVSLMAIKTMDIPDEFPEEMLAECENITVPALGKREDFRNVPLVTIDGEDSRDFDDAVYAEPDKDPSNPGGWKILVAIADVAHYVRPGSALDAEAYKRGNSVYFPDRVVPMLPEALSNDLCSLRPLEERACMVAKMTVNARGDLVGQRVVRGLMKSAARLTYTQVQAALDGHPDNTTKPLLDKVIKPLFGAYKTLSLAREARGAVDLDLPERKVMIKNGQVQDILQRARYDSHKLIEELMILANVAVAVVLEERDHDGMYRIHPKPDNTRWAATAEFLQEMGLRPKYGLSPSPKDLQALLQAAEGRDEAPLINDIILRTMSQAAYSPNNVGHFGLALERYAHFTSPIRRYADLIVHRALIRALKLGDDGLTEHEAAKLDIIGQHISDRERVAQSAERETVDRYIALFLKDKVGATFPARISGVTHFGIFVTVEPTGADGLIPVRTLPQDYYIHDEKRHSLTGRRTGLKFTLAMPLTVRLVEVETNTGRLLMELLPGQFAVAEGHSKRRFKRRERDSSDRKRRESGPRGRSRPSKGGKNRQKR